MTKTWPKVCLGASLSFLLLTGCKGSGAGHADAGDPADASTSTQPNEVADAALSEDAGKPAADGGRGGGAAAGGSGAGPTASDAGPEQPSAGGSGASTGGAASDQPPAGGGASAGAGGADDAHAGAAPKDPNAIWTSCGACEEAVPVVSTMHTNQPVNYPDPPPTSGPHNPCWATWGVHDEPLAPERWVHNLEHGGVVFLYNCPEGCAADIEALKTLSSARSRTILTAYDKLPTRFGVVSWGNRLLSDCLDQQAFARFYSAHFDRAPESNSSQPSPSCPP